MIYKKIEQLNAKLNVTDFEWKVFLLQSYYN